MSTIDPAAALLAGIDRPVAPRPEFAETLLSRLLVELRAPAAASARPRRSLRPSWFLLRAPHRLRLVLVAIALLLLLAGIATAMYVGVHAWVSSSPRGVQFTSDYRLATVFAPPPADTRWRPRDSNLAWWSPSLGPGGHDVYVIRAIHRAPLGPRGQRLPELMRIKDVDRGTRLRATRVLDFRDLTQPGWRAGSVTGWDLWPWAAPLSVASNGDVFLGVSGQDVPTKPAARGGLGNLLLFVVHVDGSRQRILAAGELIRSGVFPADPDARGSANGFMNWGIAASAPDRVWIQLDPWEGNGPQRLVKVIDPNADGDWSDRVVRRVVLPASLPFAERPTKPFTWFPEWRWQLAAEQSLPGDDRSRSVLAGAVGRGGEFRIYRIADRNEDGDALDPGEVRLLFARRDVGGSPRLAPRVITGERVTRREIAVAGLTGEDRISLVAAPGAVRDVARSFRSDGLAPLTVLAGPKGTLFPVASVARRDQRAAWVVYRLKPVVAGKGIGVVGVPVAPGPAARITLPPSMPTGVPRLMFEVEGADRGESFTIGADGRGLRRLVPGVHVRGTCQSADGRQVIYASDADVPTEFFTYIASGGGRSTKVFERHEDVLCPFSTRWLLLTRPNGGEGGTRLVRHDLRSGREIEVADDLSFPELSPDGTMLVATGGLTWRAWNVTGRQTLELLDLETLERRRLAGPHGTAEFGPSSWSPDGTRIAYYTGAYGRGRWTWSSIRHQLVLWVRDVATGSPMLRLPISGGGRPSLSWSADGTRLLVCIEDRGWQPACPAGPGEPGAIDVPHTPGRLLLVDLRRGGARVVARGRFTFAGWAPSGETFAYATRGELFVGTAAGGIRRLAAVPGPHWRYADGSGRPWLGWSPDGGYIGLSVGRERGIPVVDVRTSRLLVLRPFGRADYVNVQWWRRLSP